MTVHHVVEGVVQSHTNAFRMIIWQLCDRWPAGRPILLSNIVLG